LNEILATLSAIVGIASPLLTFLIFVVIKREILSEASDLMDDLVERGRVFYAAEKKDFSESLPLLAQNVFSPLIGNGLSQKMSELGQASGMSRSMKGLEREVIADGIDQVAPGFGGLAAKYIQRYPMLLTLIQQFAKKEGSNPQVQPPTSNW